MCCGLVQGSIPFDSGCSKPELSIQPTQGGGVSKCTLSQGGLLTSSPRRLQKKSTRKDFLSTVVKNYEEGNISKEEVAAHVSTLT